MSQRVPRVSVIMPVYNGEAYLGEALDSVLAQTLPDFELIAVDDASSDRSWSILERYAAQDARIRAVRRPRNGGHHVASNQAMALAQGDYIARLDQDDLARPQRLEVSVRYLDAHPEVGLLATGYQYVTADGRSTERLKPMTHERLRAGLVFGNCIVHSSAVLRRSVVETGDFGYEDLPGPQDYDLWVRLLEHTRGASIADALAVYRRTDESMSDLFDAEMPAAAEAISHRQLERLIGDLTTDREVYRSIRRIHGMRSVRHADYAASELLFTVYDRLALEPDLDRDELRRVRRRWIVRACSTIIRDPAAANPDRRFVAAVLRHDPLALGAWAGGDLPRRTVRHLRHRSTRARVAADRTAEAGLAAR